MERIYRALLHLYPSGLRRAHGADMALLFRDLCRDARRRGRFALAALALRTLGDLVLSAAREWVSVMPRDLLLALALGLGIGVVDHGASENQPIVLAILIVSFAFGAARPRAAWRWALCVGLGVPLVHLACVLLGRPPATPVEPNGFATLLALIPATLGAYAGALARRVVA